MTKRQGEFSTQAGADMARAALQAAGVPADAIRVWNILGENVPGSRSGSDAATGAGVGAIVGGASGLVTGAAIGGYLDNGTGLPEASGVRVVVDCAEEDAARIESVLREADASAVSCAD